MGIAARLRCWLSYAADRAAARLLLVGREGRSYTITTLAVGWDERGRSYTMTVLLAGGEERSYLMMALLAGTEGDSCTTALLAGREGCMQLHNE